MKRTRWQSIFAAALALTGTVSTTVQADPAHLTIVKAETPVTDALAALAKESGQSILADDTVVGTLGATTIEKPSLEEMLTFLVTLSPGLSWQKVFLPSSAPVPTAAVLSDQLRTLKAIASSGLIAADPTAHTTISFAKKDSETLAEAPAGMQTVYLLTNESVRAKRLAEKQAADNKKKTTAGQPLSQFTTNLQNIPAAFGQLTPAQQRQALGAMMQQAAAIWQNMDPALRSQLQQMGQQRRQNGGGAGRPGGQ